jgi:NAD(P)-dependent dehydrogenase (short-subunit alcohol dehydrogenase family)
MKQVLITGFARNIGKSICLRFLRENFNIVGTYCKDTKKEALELMAKNPAIKAFEVDFCDDNSLSELISELKQYKFDVIVNNAGILALQKGGQIKNEFYNFDYGLFQDVFKCNFFAPLRLCLELKDNINENGAIINIASGGGMRASYATLSYSSSKAALINLSLSLSNSFPRYKNVRVNIVSPGWVNPDDTTDEMGMQENAPGRKAALLTSMGRNAQTTEIADVVYYLTTKESSFINGANIVVDGGWLNHNTIYYEEAFGNNMIQ